MDEKVLEDIEFHQETVSTNDNSPLHLIREKEMEITGRVLTAKREAEDMVVAARKKAVETQRKAEEESDVLAAEQEKKVLAEVQDEIKQIAADADSDSAALQKQVAERTAKAAKFVVETVTSV